MNPGFFAPLCEWLGIDVWPSYQGFMALSVALCIPMIAWVVWRLRIDPAKALVVSVAGFYLGPVTSRLTYFLTAARAGAVASEVELSGWSGFIGSLLEFPWGGGQVYYGGLLGALATALVCGRLLFGTQWHAPTLRVLDALVFPLFLISAVGRLGCYYQGCCFGRIHQHWGVVFPPGSATAHELWRRGLLQSELLPTPPLIPTQLLEAGTSGALVMVLLVLLRFSDRLRPGFFAWHALLVHAVVRFNIEWLRFDTRGSLWVFSTSQWIALGMVLALGVGRLAAGRLHRNGAPVQGASRSFWLVQRSG